MAKGLTVKQRAALAALLDGASRQEAAAAAKVDRRTLGRWLREPAFALELRQAGDVALTASARRLTAHIDAATDAITEILSDGEAAPSVRLRAAEIVLTHSPRLLDVTDVVERIEALEKRLDEKSYD